MWLIGDGGIRNKGGYWSSFSLLSVDYRGVWHRWERCCNGRATILHLFSYCLPINDSLRPQSLFTSSWRFWNFFHLKIAGRGLFLPLNLTKLANITRTAIKNWRRRRCTTHYPLRMSTGSAINVVILQGIQFIGGYSINRKVSVYPSLMHNADANPVSSSTLSD